MAIIKKIFGDPNKKAIEKIMPQVKKINELEESIIKLSDTKLKEKTTEFKERIKKATEKLKTEEDILKAEAKVLDEILPEAFAVVREASKRTLGLRHFDVQLIGGINLHQGKISEMKTGEGKTLVATLPTYLNALTGRGVHIVTVNDYLAKRDAGWMAEIFNFLGLSVGCIVHESGYLFDKEYKDENTMDEREEHLRPITRKEAYNADITYGTNNEYGFDYLRDNMVQNIGQLVQRGQYFAIVDEVDSILIDEARTPLIISSPAEESTDKYYEFAKIVTNLKKGEDYEIDEKLKASSLTSQGIKKLERLLNVQNIYEEKGIDTVHHIEQALKAMTLFSKDRDYVVKEGEVIIVDEFTGRLMPGRRYSEGLHQALEAKENVEIQRESLTLATISFQNYFRLYNKLAGMTGTAETEAEEFKKIYELEVLVIPTNRDVTRADANDQIYKTEDAKFKAVAQNVKKLNEKGQPVLVGTVSIEKNEKLSKLLKQIGVKHELLNAKNHEREAAIISRAGEKGAVTVATNMAGRGTDIVLDEESKKLGGLVVIGTERHEARRIDNQLRGRSGRQGDPGVTQFYVSTEDDLMRIFGSDRVGMIMGKLGFPEEQAIEHPLISKSLESAQRKVEGHNFDIRKHLVEYDDVMNKQREIIYKKRREILESEFDEDLQQKIKDSILDMIEEEVTFVVGAHSNQQTGEIDKEELWNSLNTIAPINPEIKKQLTKLDPEELPELFKKELTKAYEEKEKANTPELMRILERAMYLRTIDMLWVDHLDAIGHLREGIGLRGYGQREPLVEYKNESYDMFQKLLAGIRGEIVYNIFKVEITKNEPAENVEKVGEKPEEDLPRAPENKKENIDPKDPNEKVGRNDPCPCGAVDQNGKPVKYKKCHGRNA